MTYLGVFGELGELLLREYSSEYSSNCDEAIFRVKKSSLNMFWEYSPSSTNLAHDWLKAQSCPVNEEERKIEMDDRVDTSLVWRELTYLLNCGRQSHVSWIQNDIVVS